MAILSGLNGSVNGSTTVEQWGITTVQDAKEYRASNTKGGTGRISGNGDWNGSYTALGHTPEVDPGEEFTFDGWAGIGTSGATGTARCDNFVLNWDIEGGEPISHTVNFSSNGVLTKSTSSYIDTSIPNPPSSVMSGSDTLKLGGVERADVRTMTLTVSKANPSYVSSSTSGGTRRQEGNFDFTFEFTVYESDLDALPDEGDDLEIKAYVNATEFWHLKWAQVLSVGNFLVNPSSGEIIGATISCSMNGYVGGVEGFVKKPANAAPQPWP